jgi:nucleoside-diphosphate-sugar epimerase
MKKILVLGGGGFIGGHLAKKLKDEGNWVRVVDIKKHEYFTHEEMCDEFLTYDLRDPQNVKSVVRLETHKNSIAPFSYLKQPYCEQIPFDEVYQLAADMGGAGYIFTGEHDADVMHNSAMINLNVAKECADTGVKKIFYSSSACMYPEHNQLDPNNPNCEESSAYPANPDSEYGWEKLFSERLFLSFYRNYGLNVS